MKINVREVSKSYKSQDDEVEVLQGISIELPSGVFASLTGPSGVGKSTLLHLLGTLDFPTQGNIQFDDIDVAKLDPAEISYFRNQTIGFVFQFHHLLPEFSALENVMMPMLVSRESRTKAENNARDWLAQVGLSHRVSHKPGELSGGEQQRVALARAYINKPRLLLADEPTGNLDEETGNCIMDVIEKVHRERGVSTIIVTHNQNLANRAPLRLHLRKEGLSILGGS